MTLQRRTSSPLLSVALAAVGMIAASAAVTPARGAFLATVTGTATSATGGGFNYTYTLTDLANSTLNASELDLTIGSIAILSNIANSAGWDVNYAPGVSTISFTSSASSLDLTPGQTATFTFFSTTAPSTSNDLIRSLDDFGTPQGTVSGLVLTPVPEPASLALVGVGLGGLALNARRRARRRQPR